MPKSYKELLRSLTFEERFEYLKMGGRLGESTFGFDRYLNQALYQSPEWRRIRSEVLLRDEGCDLGISDRKIFVRPIVHHINPITIADIENRAECIFDLDNLITTSHDTHNAIHFGDASLLARLPKERKKGDTTLWIVS